MATLKLKVDPTGMERGAARGKNALKGVSTQAHKTEKSVKNLGAHGSHSMFSLANSMKMVGIAAATMAAMGVVRFVTEAKNLDAALGEASTLIKGTTTQMMLMRSEAQKMASQFGGSTTDQVSAFYQAISAGSPTVKDASVLLKSANKLAVGGVTDVKTAVDVLTSAMNAYEKTGLTAAKAADVLFTGVKAGKTTVTELAIALGRAIPFASSLGISFDELVSGVAALTTQGQSTALAVTGMRASMVGVLRPTKEAVDVAKALGIEFNALALKRKGFGAFMADIVAKTGGSQVAMTRLFGSTEALTAVLAFAGTGGDKFAATMGLMTNSAGAADDAFQKMKSTLSKRFDVSISKLSVAAEKMGTVLFRAVVPAVDALANNLPTALAAVASLGVALAVTFAPITGIIIAAGGAISLLTLIIGTPSDGKGLTSGLYDAKDGTDALNAALSLFEKTGAPNAGRAAVALANEHYALAQSSVVAAKAQVALMRTELSAQKSAAGVKGNVFGADLVAQSQADLELALNSMDTQINALQNAVAERDKALSRLRYGGTGAGTNIAPTTISLSPQQQALQDKVAKLLADMADSSANTGTAVASVGSAFDQLSASLDPAIAASQQYAIAQEIVAKALKSGTIDQTEANRILLLAKEAYGTASASALSFREALLGISDTIANDIGDGLLSMADGTKTVTESFRSMASDVVRELYRVLVVQRLVASFKNAIGGGGFTVGKLFGGSSFAGGGYTGNAPRTGGLDGQGGFLAMMHPKETVVDHTKGQAGGSNITINQTFTGGVTREDLGNAVPRIVEASKAAVLNAMKRHQGGFA